jgi:hypothetical protein
MDMMSFLFYGRKLSIAQPERRGLKFLGRIVGRRCTPACRALLSVSTEGCDFPHIVQAMWPFYSKAVV